MKQDLDKGQHFLIDKEVIKKEVEIAKISKKDRVIEVGAGEGNLTTELIKRAGKVIAFEIDKRYSKKLCLLERNNRNLNIIYDNALNYSWKNCTKIVSNIPYFISEQLVKKSVFDDVPFLVLIVGENFKKIIEEKKTKIGIIANLFYNIKPIVKVNQESFFPKPKVDSWLIKFEKKKELEFPDSVLASIIKKRGKIKNALIHALMEIGKTKRESRIIIGKMDLHKQILEKQVSRITGKFLIRLEKELKKLQEAFKPQKYLDNQGAED